MKMIKRVQVSIMRSYVKTSFFFLIMLIIGTLVSAAISTSQAIINTEMNLLRQLPPVATIHFDSRAISEYEELHGVWPEFDLITLETIEAIGNLPEVKFFDYAIYQAQLFSSRLRSPRNVAPYMKLEWGWSNKEEMISTILEDHRQMLGDLERFTLKGVANPLITDLEMGLIELKAGRIFTTEELESGSPIALISQGFADENSLSIGGTFSLDQNFYKLPDIHFVGDFEDHLWLSEPVELTVIGIFEPTVQMDDQANSIDFDNHVTFNSRIYVPLEFARQPTLLFIDSLQRAGFGDSEEYQDLFNAPFRYDEIIFVLDDILHLAEFHQSAQEFLPEFTFIHDLTYEFEAISDSMQSMNDIASLIIIGVSVASLTVVGLLILLFLSDRKHEIGIYLALGESKWKIVCQIVTEVAIVSVVALTLSLLIGHVLADHLSMTMLRQDLIDNPHLFPTENMDGFNDFNWMGFGLQMTGEEMLENYSVTLSGRTIVVFYGLSLLMVSFSTIIPTLYLLRFKPKDILLKASIG